MKMNGLLRCTIGIVVLFAFAAPGMVHAQIPPLVAAELVKMGPVVDPGCTGKLYRPLFGKNDYNTYWPVDAAMPNKNIKLFPGVTVTRDVSYGPAAKDLIDIFVPDKGGSNPTRTIFIFVPGGAGNKIEQQSVESNMFYDNIGKWAAENGMVGVTMQRGGTAAGQNIALVIEWLQANAAKYKGNSADMFIMAHSAGTGPLTQYIGRPDLYGLGVKGAIFMGGHPMILAGGGGGRGGGGGGGRGGAGAAAERATCSVSATTQAGPIRGPSSSLPEQGAGAAAERARLAGFAPWRWDGSKWISTGAVTPPAAAPAGGGRGGGAPGGGAPGGGGPGGGAAPGGAPGGGGAGQGGRGGGAPGGGAPGGGGAGQGGRAGGGAPGGPPAAGAAPAAPAAPAFTTLDGFKTTRAAIALAWGELDVDATAPAGMPTQSVAIRNELCKLEGPKAKDGVGHCPTMMWFKGESHMSEVFSFGSIDKTVSDPVMAFIRQHH